MTQVKEKLTLRSVLTGLGLAIVLALGILVAALSPSRTLIGGWLYRRNEGVLDLSGQGIRSLSGLRRLNDPQYLDLRGNELDLRQLLELQERFPGCEIRCEVPIGAERIDNSTSYLRLTLLREYLLPLFPRLKTLELQDVQMEPEERRALEERYPELDILFTREAAAGVYFADKSEVLDLSGVTGFRLSTLAKNLSAFPAVKTIKLTGCGFDNESLLVFRKSLKNISVEWDVNLYGKSFLSTATEIDLSGQWIADLAPLEEALPCFSALERVVMCNCGVPDTDMDALDKRYPDIRFLWEVNFGVFHLRTDATRFLALAWEDGYTWLNNEQLIPLSYCRDLVALDLGHMWFSDTEFLRGMTKLRWLILGDNRISDLTPLAELQELTYLELFLCDVEDISPLLSCKNLRHLNLAYCPVKNIGLLAQLPQLERLWLNGCNIDYGAIQALRQALPNTLIVTEGESSTGAGWRQHEAYYEMRDAFAAPYME